MLQKFRHSRHYREGSISAISCLLSSIGQYHKVPEIRALRRIVREMDVDCIFDVGANAGQYATMLRRWVGYKGLIISFEPHPDLHSRLVKLSNNNPLWQIEQVALSKVTGQIPFHLTHDTQFSSAETPKAADGEAFASNVKIERTVMVPSETLNHGYQRLQEKFKFKRAFLKMDTQGHDLVVFRSGLDVVQNFVGLQSELSFRPYYEGVPLFTEQLAEYEKSKFLLNAMFLNTRGHFPLLREMDCVMVNGARVNCA